MTRDIIHELEMILYKIKSGEYIPSSIIVLEKKIPIRSEHKYQSFDVNISLLKKIKNK
jgi:hypothetical protein